MNENNNIIRNNPPISEIKEFKLLLNLLDKAEQILSIINLPDSSIAKYNTLKKMTFEILNIEFKPLEKKFISSSNSENNNNNINIQNNIDDIIYILHFLNIKKSMLIDLILDFIKNNNNIEQEKNLNFFLTSLTDIYNLPESTITSKNVEDITYDTKNEESKIAELFTKIDNVFVNTFENIKNMKANYDNELITLKENYNRDLSELKKSLEKNNNLESDLFKVRKENEKNNYFLDKMSLLINESYEKYKKNFPVENNVRSIAYKDGNFDEDIMKLEFLKKILDNFFDGNNNVSNNSYIRNDNPNLRKDNIRLENNYNLPYNNNFDKINNTELKNDIFSYLPEIQKESDIFHKNFCDLMNYIETNIEGKVI